MKTLSVSEAREILNKLISEGGLEHQPIQIRGKGASAILLHEDDWLAIQETLYLLSIPGMRESIRDGLNTPLDECSEIPGW